MYPPRLGELLGFVDSHGAVLVQGTRGGLNNLRLVMEFMEVDPIDNVLVGCRHLILHTTRHKNLALLKGKLMEGLVLLSCIVMAIASSNHLVVLYDR